MADLVEIVAGKIHHVGSTSVPGLAAKPAVDILAEVESLAKSRAAIEPLAALSYLWAPYLEEEMNILRAEPDTAAAYAELKRRLARTYRHDREAYTVAKTEFVEAVLADVLPVTGDP